MSDRSGGDGWWQASDGTPGPAPLRSSSSRDAVAPTEPGIGRGAWNGFRGRPMWGQIAAGVAVLALIGGAVGCSDESANSSSDTTTTAGIADIEEAVQIAAVDVEGVSDDDIASLIESMCDSASADDLAEAVAAFRVADASDALAVIEGAGAGAEAYCPDEVAENPGLLNDTYAAAVLLLQPATTTTKATTTTTTAAPTTAAPTTAAPPPPPPPPPTTAPPSPGVYYANCTEARNAGAAPLYVGDPGYRSGLDRDNDGVACE